jgi:hypothetical protein
MVCFQTIRCDRLGLFVPQGLEDRSLPLLPGNVVRSEARPSGTA